MEDTLKFHDLVEVISPGIFYWHSYESTATARLKDLNYITVCDWNMNDTWAATQYLLTRLLTFFSQDDFVLIIPGDKHFSIAIEKENEHHCHCILDKTQSKLLSNEVYHIKFKSEEHVVAYKMLLT